MSLVSRLPRTASTRKALQNSLNASLGLAHLVQEAHWNVKGMAFAPLHELFGEIYDFLIEASDDVAERIVQLEGKAVASPVTEHLSGDEHELLAGVQGGLENLGGMYIDIVRASAQDDPSTNNLVLGLLQSLEKWIWKVESHLKMAGEMPKKSMLDIAK